MTVRLFILAGILLITLGAAAQDSDDTAVVRYPGNARQHLTGSSFYFGRKYTGDIYFNIDFEKGDVYLTNGEAVNGLSLKYCGATGELIYFNEPNKTSVSVDPEIVDRFTVYNPRTNQVSTFKRMLLKKGLLEPEQWVFAEVLHDGVLKLYVLRENRIVGTRSLKEGYHTYYRDEYAAEPTYVILIPGQDPVYLSRIRRKAVLGLYPSGKRELLAIMHENRLRSIRNERQLKRFIELLDGNSDM
jgi:hypothetical protein